MAVVIAGERSGSGKTTITLALLAALKAKNQLVQSFKVGPDYIDPMFHAYVTNRPCYNLDMVLTSERYLPQCFAFHTQDVEIAVVEGVMGLFDGAAEPSGYGSTAQVAKLLGLPTLLVLNCSSLSQSVAAMLHGYRSFDPDLNLAGVVLNRVGSDRHLEILKTALEPLKIPIVGVFRREDEIALPDRHLGLVPAAELPQLDQIIDKLATLGLSGFDWDLLRPLLGDRGLNSMVYDQPEVIGAGDSFCVAETHPKFDLQRLDLKERPIRLGVARDRAFSFYYADNLELLERLGAELVYWSPLDDEKLPENIQGFYFGGGFPEMFAPQLAENRLILAGLKRAIEAGVLTYAECGGLMYLSEAIIDFEGNLFPMVGVLPTQTVMGKRLTLGYRSALAQAQTPIFQPGDVVQGHEFHRSTVTNAPTQPLFKMQRRTQVDRAALEIADPQLSLWEGWYNTKLQASYLHLHWGATPQLPMQWLALMRQ